jgi:cytochrome c5
VKRILGTVPVHPDGSAAFRIPAERRVFFQPLDEHGMALQSMRSWVEAMPGEQISCVGCHERSAEPPPRKSIMALQHEPVAPSPWYGPPRSFSFPREVQPVLDRYCVACHNEEDPGGIDLRGDATNWFSLAYENLRPYVNPIGPQGSADIPEPKSQGAVASRLVAMLQSGHEGVILDNESLDRIVTWIDLNIPYYDNTAVTRPSHVALSNEVTGSGRAVVADAKPLWNALGNRCQTCHPGGFRIDPAVAPCQVPELPETLVAPILNLTHPEQSRILTAPLAQSAGGLQQCAQAVFADRNDPAYRAALHVIQGWHEELVARPREDMPGFVPCDAYHQTQAKRAAWLRLEYQAREELARQ